MSARPPRGAHRSFLLVLVLAASLGGAEALLRHFAWPAFDACSATATFADPDPELGFVGPPNGVVAGRQLNAEGLRGPLVEQPKPPDRYRILFLGDSTTWGLGLPLEESYAARTTALLAGEHPERTFDFVIGAFPGYSSYHSRVLLERLLPLAPDLVVFYVGARNDPSRHRYFRDAEIPARRARLDAPWHQIHLLRLVEAGSDRLYKSVLRKVLPGDARARVSVAAYRANLEAMFTAVEQEGAEALAVVPPISKQFEEEEPLAVAYRDALLEVAAASRVPVVKLQAAFDGAPDAFFDDGYHFAPPGHAIAAREIHRAIVGNAVLHATRR